MFRSTFGWLIGSAVFAFSVCPASAQQIQGQVRYVASGQPVLSALVECDGTSGNSQELTDRDGKFSFGVSPGHYTVSVRVPGYRPEEQSVDLVQNQSEYMLFRVRSDPSTANKLRPNSPTMDANVPPGRATSTRPAHLPGLRHDRARHGAPAVGDGSRRQIVCRGD